MTPEEEQVERGRLRWHSEKIHEYEQMLQHHKRRRDEIEKELARVREGFYEEPDGSWGIRL